MTADYDGLLREASEALLSATGAFEALRLLGADKHLPGFRHTLEKVKKTARDIDAELAEPRRQAANRAAIIEECARVADEFNDPEWVSNIVSAIRALASKD